MPVRDATAQRPPARPGFNRAWLCLGAGVFVLLMVALRWDRAAGFTSLIDFGQDWTPRRLPVLQGAPLATVPGGGYDGQFYAQIAVAPHPLSPDLQRALDDPAYRSRRILLPLLAHLAGGGQPWVVLQIYALLNFACWCALGWVWWREVGVREARGAAVWLACLLSLGALDSVRLSLTDLPATLCLVLAARAVEAKRPYFGAVWFLMAGFVRETSVLAAGLLRFSEERTLADKAKAWVWRAAWAVPPVLWCLWLARNVPGENALRVFDWPGIGPAREMALCARQLAAGNFDSRYLFGLLGTLGLGWQSLHLLRHWRENDVWVRLGLPFALLFWVLGPYVFSGYWAAARACLPLTFAFNRRLLRGDRFWLGWMLGNCFALHGIYRMLP